MNLDTARQAIRDFVSASVPIYRWDVDEPDVLYYNRGGANITANSAIELPLQDFSTSKNGYNGVKASGRFPYRVTWIFRGDQPLSSLPFKSVEGVVANIHVLAHISSPHPEIQLFQPYPEPDPVTIARTEDESKNWLLSANFSFNCEFQVTSFADVGDLTEPGFYDFPEPIPLTGLGIRIYKAKIGFDSTDSSTFQLDRNLTITP